MGDTRTPAVRHAQDQVAAAMGRDLVNDALRTQGVLAIVQPPLGKVSFGRAVYGSVSVNVGATTGNGVTLWLDRDPHPFEGTRRVRITITEPFEEDGTVRPKAKTKVDDFVARIAQLQQRDVAIEAAGEDKTMPGATHYRVHELVARFADHAGVTRDELCELDRFPQGGRSTIDTPHGKRVRPIYRHDDAKWAIVGVTAEARGNRIVVSDGSFDLDKPVSIKITEHAKDLSLQLRKLFLPETVVTTMRGQMLCDVVDHPAVKGMDLRIISATPDRTGIILKLPTRLVQLSAK